MMTYEWVVTSICLLNVILLYRNSIECISVVVVFFDAHQLCTWVLWVCCPVAVVVCLVLQDFTDEHFLKRRPHPNFQPHIDLEKKVVHMGKTVSLVVPSILCR